MERYIFLDINGVLDIGSGLDPALLDRFATLVKETESIVVLASTWRRHGETFKLIRDPLRERGIPLRWTTPFCPYEKIKDNPRYHKSRPQGEVQRTHEILLWLEGREPVAWVAIDDMDLRLDESNRVRTHEFSGLTEEKAKEAKTKLMGAAQPA